MTNPNLLAPYPVIACISGKATTSTIKRSETSQASVCATLRE
jgi:hypothetical protein